MGQQNDEMPPEFCIALIDGDFVAVTGNSTMALYQEKHGGVKYIRAGLGPKPVVSKEVEEAIKYVKNEDNVMQDDDYFRYDDMLKVIIKAATNPPVSEKLRIAEEALESIAKNTCCDKCQQAALVSAKALAAMKEKLK
jgi:hypothetical protein